VTTVLLLDFGGVLHDPGDTSRLDALAERLGEAPFVDRYLAGRLAFDRGQSTSDYWAAVLGRRLGASELADATQVDTAVGRPPRPGLFANASTPRSARPLARVAHSQNGAPLTRARRR
jgi:hypothetical protein